ncbi:MAG: tail fiber domain-containing protein [bacterium]|nr:tail fiber domain-containing protein [bacterium]
MTEPAALPLWDTNETNTSAPGGSRQTDGWIYVGLVPEKAPAEVWNYWMNNVYKWINHLDIRVKESDSYTDTGAANAYVLDGGSDVLSLTDGQLAAFTTANSNTGASTANVGGLGAIDVRLPGGGGALTGGEIINSNRWNYMRYNASSARWLLDTDFNTSDHINISIGRGAGLADGGSANVYVGKIAGASNNSGVSNVCIGDNSGNVLDGGDLNTLVGTNSGFSLVGGDYNVCIGGDSGSNIVSSTYNTFVGQASGYGMTGGYNTVLGAYAGFAALTLDSNVIIGSTAATAATALATSVVIGATALNTGVGAAEVVIIGMGAGQKDTGSRNVLVGFEAGQNNTSGASNTFVGWKAGNVNITTGYNAFFGTSAGQLNTGGNNAYFGAQAGWSATGSNNVAVGRQSGSYMTGNNNTCLGNDSGGAITSGYSNTFLGSGLASPITTGDSNVFIGYLAGNNVVTSSTSEEFILANGPNAIDILISGDFSTGQVTLPNLANTGSTTALMIDGSGNLVIDSSSKRFKENINYDDINSDFILNLKPAYFNRIGTSILELGLIAEDCESIYKNMVNYEKDGKTCRSVSYGADTTTGLIHKVQELHEKDLESQKRIDDLEERLERLESTLML